MNGIENLVKLCNIVCKFLPLWCKWALCICTLTPRGDLGDEYSESNISYYIVILKKCMAWYHGYISFDNIGAGNV